MEIFDYDTHETHQLTKGTEVEIIGFIRHIEHPDEIVVEIQWNNGYDWLTGKPLLKLFRADGPVTSVKKGLHFQLLKPKALVSARYSVRMHGNYN